MSVHKAAVAEYFQVKGTLAGYTGPGTLNAENTQLTLTSTTNQDGNSISLMFDGANWSCSFNGSNPAHAPASCN